MQAAKSGFWGLKRRLWGTKAANLVSRWFFWWAFERWFFDGLKRLGKKATFASRLFGFLIGFSMGFAYGFSMVLQVLRSCVGFLWVEVCKKLFCGVFHVFCFYTCVCELFVCVLGGVSLFSIGVCNMFLCFFLWYFVRPRSPSNVERRLEMVWKMWCFSWIFWKVLLRLAYLFFTVLVLDIWLWVKKNGTLEPLLVKGKIDPATCVVPKGGIFLSNFYF